MSLPKTKKKETKANGVKSRTAIGYTEILSYIFFFKKNRFVIVPIYVFVYVQHANYTGPHTFSLITPLYRRKTHKHTHVALLLSWLKTNETIEFNWNLKCVGCLHPIHAHTHTHSHSHHSN